jgi:hypothetical protein
VGKRWRDRGAQGDAPLTQDEAVEAAKAALHAQGHTAGADSVLDAEGNADGSWTVRLHVTDTTFRVRVPRGDPGQARILIEGGADLTPR